MVLGLYCLDCITRALCFLLASLNQECLVGFYFKKQGTTSMCFYGSCPSQVSKCTWGFMYPIYGHGELPQAFCRCAAVKGCIHVSSSQGIHSLVF